VKYIFFLMVFLCYCYPCLLSYQRKWQVNIYKLAKCIRGIYFSQDRNVFPPSLNKYFPLFSSFLCFKACLAFFFICPLFKVERIYTCEKHITVVYRVHVIYSSLATVHTFLCRLLHIFLILFLYNKELYFSRMFYFSVIPIIVHYDNHLS